MSKLVPLTQGKSARVSDADFARVMQHKWAASFVPNPNGGGYWRAITSIDGELVLMHRFIMGAFNADDIIDHRNFDTLDNRRENLRRVTHTQNMEHRRGAQVNSKTGVRGVCLLPTGKYKAYIQHERISYNLGHFDTIEEAVAARKAAEKKYFTHAD